MSIAHIISSLLSFERKLNNPDITDEEVNKIRKRADQLIAPGSKMRESLCCKKYKEALDNYDNRTKKDSLIESEEIKND